MPKYDDYELAGILEQEISRAEGSDQDEISAVRELALDYYYERQGRFPSVQGRSSVVSGDTSQMVNAVLAAMLPMVAIDSVAMFEPDGEADEDQARLESQVVNHMIVEKNRGYVAFHESIKDALMLRTAVMRCWAEEVETTEVITIDASSMSDDDVQLLLEKEGPTETGRELIEHTDDIARFAVTYRKNVFKVGSVDPGNFLYAVNHDSVFLDDIRFCAERQLMTRSDLEARGYDRSKVDGLAPLESETKGDVFARNRNFEPSYEAWSRDQDIIEIYDCYIRLDQNGDGISELWNVIFATPQTILHKEEAPWVPYAVGTPFISSHRLLGESLAEKLKHVQDVKTATLRQWLDNLDVSNNTRLGVVESQVNLDDAINSRPGGIIRMMSPDSITPIPSTDVGPSAMALLDYMDKIRAERGGASLDMQNSDRQLVNKQISYSTLSKQYSVLEQLAEMMSRNLAETLVRSLYLLAHKTLRHIWREPVQAQLAGQWIVTDPSEWRERDRVNVRIGLSPGQREHRQQTMQELVQWQLGVQAQGKDGILTDDSGLHKAMTDYLHSAGVDAPEQYLVDPNSQAAQQTAQAMAEAQQAQQQQLMQMQQQMATLQATIEQSKLQLEKYKADHDTAFKYYDARLKAEIAEAELVGQATRDLEVAQLQGEFAERQAARAAEAGAPGAGNGGG